MSLRHRRRRSLFFGGSDAYAVAGLNPNLVFDFASEYYRTSTNVSTFDNSLTYTGASAKTMVGSGGLVQWAPHNIVLNSATPATQNITVVSGQDYTVECTGTGSITLSGAGSGSASLGSPVEITAGTTTLTLTIVGSVDTMWCYRSDLGGMVHNPDRGDSYVPTTSAAVYLPRRGHHIYNGSTWVNEGLLLESEARTNLLTYSHEFDNAAWPKPANVTVTPNTATGPDGVSSADTMANTATNEGISRLATASTNTVYTTSVYIKKKAIGDADTPGLYVYFKTGGVTTYQAVVINTYTGALTPATAPGFTAPLAYSGEDCGDYWRLSVSGDSVNNTVVGWVFYNDYNPTAGGSRIGDQQIYGAQMEAGSTPSSYIPTAGATVTRAAETLTVAAANLPYSATNMSIQMDGEMTYADTGNTLEVQQFLWSLNATNYIRAAINTQTTRTGQFYFTQRDGGTALDSVSSGVTYFTPGVNVSYNLAVRYGATFINGAEGGTALTANETPTVLPDLSATNMLLGYTYMGTIGKFRMWDADLGDTGIAEAST